MNEKNVRAAIAIMRRAQNLDMCYFQYGYVMAHTEKELHRCGNTACFAGYVAISPEFRADGGHVFDHGAPAIGDYIQTDAIAHWLGISDELAASLVFNHCYVDDEDFYPVPFDDVKPHHVIEKLELILKGELQ